MNKQFKELLILGSIAVAVAVPTFSYQTLYGEIKPLAKAAWHSSTGDACSEFWGRTFCVSYRGNTPRDNPTMKNLYRFTKVFRNVPGAELCEYVEHPHFPGLYCLRRIK